VGVKEKAKQGEKGGHRKGENGELEETKESRVRGE